MKRFQEATCEDSIHRGNGIFEYQPIMLPHWREFAAALDQYSVSYNQIFTEGSTWLSDYLARNPCLNTLRPGENPLRWWCEVYCKGSPIEHKLKRARPSKIGSDALELAVIDISSLSTTADCNHTCQIYLTPRPGDFVMRRKTWGSCRYCCWTSWCKCNVAFTWNAEEVGKGIGFSPRWVV